MADDSRGASTPTPAPAPAETTDESSGVPDDRCAECGATVDRREWHPVAKARDSDGTLQLYPFCSEDCRTDWQAEHAG